MLIWNLKNWFAKTAAAVILVIRTIYTLADIAEQNMFLQMMGTILFTTIIIILVLMILRILQIILRKILRHPKVLA